MKYHIRSAASLLLHLRIINLQPTELLAEQHSTGLPSPSSSTFHPLQLLSGRLKADIEFMCTCVCLEVCVCVCVCHRPTEGISQVDRSQTGDVFQGYLCVFCCYTSSSVTSTQSLWKNRKTRKTTTHSLTFKEITAFTLRNAPILRRRV